MGANKGLWEKMQEEKSKYKGLTLELLEQAINDFYLKSELLPTKYYMPACAYPTLSDEEFRELAGNPHIKFIGGSKGVEEFLERYNRLTKE